MRKGISPLIAAVILIAFVVAVAGIASTFFSGFTKQQQVQVQEKGESTVECALAVVSIDPDTVSNTSVTNVRFVLENTGTVDLTGLKVVTFNATATVTDSTPTPTTISKSDIVTMSADSIVLDGIVGLTKIRVTTTTCPGVGTTAENQTAEGKGWVLKA